MPPPSVVVGTVACLSRAVRALRLADLSALVLDDATAFLQDPPLQRDLLRVIDTVIAKANNWGKIGGGKGMGKSGFDKDLGQIRRS